jgi:glutamate N-acetyltransferase/amino-acid N-acetyltransferase
MLAGVTSAVAALSRDGATAARGIMTTDLGPKEHAVHVETAGGVFHVGGIAKGAGMIEPMLATMLSFMTTDAAVPPALLDRALREVTGRTFNAITVDGECSTNDTLAVLASGASGVTIDESSYPALVSGLEAVARTLALAIVRGGEGATKLVAIHITGAVNDQDAMRAAKTIANSPLVKTAVHGGDPNWGRLVAAAGRSGVPFAIDRALVRVGPVVLFRDGQPYDEAAPRAADYLRGTDIDIEINVGAGGSGEATVWTCDLSAEYVRINGEYRT